MTTGHPYQQVSVCTERPPRQLQHCAPSHTSIVEKTEQQHNSQLLKTVTLKQDSDFVTQPDEDDIGNFLPPPPQNVWDTGKGCGTVRG